LDEVPVISCLILKSSETSESYSASGEREDDNLEESRSESEDLKDGIFELLPEYLEDGVFDCSRIWNSSFFVSNSICFSCKANFRSSIFICCSNLQTSSSCSFFLNSAVLDAKSTYPKVLTPMKNVL